MSPKPDPEAAHRFARLLEVARVSGWTSDTEIANQSGLIPDYFSKLKRGTKNFGSTLARRVEKKIGLAKGFLDQIDDVSEALLGRTYIDDAKPDEYVQLKLLDLKAGAGPGRVNPAPEMVGLLTILRSVLTRLGITDPDTVGLWNVDGASMEKTAPHESVALVNKRVRSYKGEGVYVIRIDDDIIIKRLQRRIDGAYIVQSDNDDKARYPDMIITRDQLENVEIYGKMFWVFKGQLVI